ncbi:hypothetical protein CCP3SC1_520022 [Gammaproteobacteria bacterium]
MNLSILLNQRKYVAVCTLNSFPGTFSVIGWNNKKLLIESDIALTTENQDERFSSFSEGSKHFEISYDSCAIHQLDYR